MARPSSIRLNLAGFRQLRTSDDMDRLVLGKAQKAADILGDGFEARLSPGKNRARAVVVPVTADAVRRVAEDPNLIISALKASA